MEKRSGAPYRADMVSQVNQSLIHSLWKDLSEKEFDHASDSFKCLAQLEESFAFYNLGDPPGYSIDTKRTHANFLNTVTPSFKNLTEDILLELRLNIYQKQDDPKTGVWTEKLLRFSELNMSRLKTRLNEKIKDHLRIRVFGLQWVCLFLDEHFRTGDYRFLNTALKMQDLGWLYSDKMLPNEIRRHPTHHPVPLLQFRILLNTAFALSRINQRG